MRLQIRSGLVLVSAVAFMILSDIAHADVGDLVEIYEYTGKYSLNDPPPTAKPIIVEVPEKFRYGSSRGVSRNWGLNILTYYPSFTSPSELENASAGLDCAGYCNGRILISIENRANSINNPRWLNSPNMADVIGRIDPELYIQSRGNTTVPIGPEHRFDKGYEITTPPRGELKPETHLYLFHFAADQIHYDLTAECTINQFARTCRLFFSLQCNPGVYVQVVGIDMRLVEELLEMRNKVDRFVSSMMRQPACVA